MRSWTIFLFGTLGVYWIDQGIKDLFLHGYQWQSQCLSLELHLNKGVAFSMFAWLGSWLKWIQVFLVGGLFLFFAKEGWIRKHPWILGFLAGAALGNLSDRFLHGAVVDYFYWHCGFDFAVFNFADVMIDLSIFLLLWQGWREHRKTSKGMR